MIMRSRWRASRRRGRHVLAALMCAVALDVAGCGILPKVQEPLDLYSLSPKTTFQDPLPKVDWQLVVELPVADASIDTPRIALSRNPYSIEYYAKASWTDNAPAMVQTLMIESFESTHSIVAVGREAIGLRPDFILKTDLREFQANYEGSDPIPTVVVRMNAKLVQMPDRRITASRTVEERVKATGSTFNVVIDAFDEALGSAIKQIVVFTLTTPRG